MNGRALRQFEGRRVLVNTDRETYTGTLTVLGRDVIELGEPAQVKSGREYPGDGRLLVVTATIRSIQVGGTE